jgi:hypothetical protein
MERPCPDLANLAQSDIDLKSIVTHPPTIGSTGQVDAAHIGTAV